MEVGDWIRAISKDGYTVISGCITGITEYSIVVQQSDGTRRYINQGLFDVEKVKP